MFLFTLYRSPKPHYAKYMRPELTEPADDQLQASLTLSLSEAAKPKHELALWYRPLHKLWILKTPPVLDK